MTSPPGQWAIEPGPSVTPVDPAVTAPARCTIEIGACVAGDVHLAGAAQPLRGPTRHVAADRGPSRGDRRCRGARWRSSAPGRRRQGSRRARARAAGPRPCSRSRARRSTTRRSRQGCRRSPATHRWIGSARGAATRVSARPRRRLDHRATARPDVPSRRAPARLCDSLSSGHRPHRRPSHIARSGRRTRRCSATRSCAVILHHGGRCARR